MKIVCISDTHNRHEQLNIPFGDILVHAGDFTGHSSVYELEDFAKWFGSQPHEYKVFIPGNHDLCFEDSIDYALQLTNNYDIITLIDNEIVIDGVKFYGTPQQPIFYDWAFNRTPEELVKAYSVIPYDTDVLITHTPPYGVLDKVLRGGGLNVGSRELSDAIHKVKPKLHIFGHIHEGYGEVKKNSVHYINAAICNNQYMAVNQSIVVNYKGNE